MSIQSAEIARLREELERTEDALHSCVLDKSRLRAEAERLQHINANLLKEKDGIDKDLFGTVCFERDEALAQVAGLFQANLHASIGHDGRTGFSDLCAFCLWRKNLPAKARALLDRLHELEKEPVITLPDGRNVSIGELVELQLECSDRLQRAEAVVEAAEAGKLLAEQLADLIIREDIPEEDLREASETLLPRIYDFFLGLKTALAAWEERDR